jgi:hypothetical protein
VIEYMLSKERKNEANIPLLERAVREGLRLATPSESELN